MTTEELAKKYGGKKASGSADEIAKKYGGQTSSAPAATTTKAPENKSIGRKVFDFFTSSTQKFGKTIGDAINAPEAAKSYGDDLIAHTDLQNQLLKAIQKKKALGQDTSQLEGALQAHIESTPKLEDYTGDVINKTTGQVLGEAAGTGLEALQGGVLGKGTEAATKPATSIAEKFVSGAKLGGGYGAASGAANALQDKENPLSGALKGGIIGGLTGGTLEAGIGKVSSMASRGGAKAEQAVTNAEEKAGRILLSEKAEQKTGAKVLSNLDTKGVKTYDDLVSKLDTKVKTLSKDQDNLLSKDLSKKKVGNLSHEIDVEGTKVKNNYVKDAINELTDYYRKTKNLRAETEMKNLAAKARKTGLTNQEINTLARRHGKDLNAFNASGELASGLSKQAAENTRSGLKATVRDLDKTGTSGAIDKELSDTIRVRDLAKDVQSKVQGFKNKAEKVGILRKTGAAVGKAADLATGGFLKGALRSIEGLADTKQQNYGQIEKSLQKNLKVLQKLETLDLSKETQQSLAKKISDFINQEVNIK